MKLPLKILPLLAILACETRVNDIPPEAAARDWLQRTATPYEGAPDCTGADSDHDGYVTCVVRRPKNDVATGEFLSLQCAALTSSQGCTDPPTPYTSGCKPTAVYKQ